MTFLFTDVQGSTRLWEDFPDLMMQALDQQDEAIDNAVASHNGVSVPTERGFRQCVRSQAGGNPRHPSRAQRTAYNRR